MDFQTAWQTIREQVKDQVTGRSVWQAIDAVVPITLEGDLVVLGIMPSYSNLAGHLRTPGTKHVIERSFAEVLGRRIEVLVIEGSSLQDWEQFKRRREEALKLEEQQFRRQATEQRSYTDWEAVYEQAGRRFAELAARTLAQNRAKYLQDMILLVREALENIGVETEQDERQLNRVIERIANNTNVPSTLIAWLILYRQF